MKVETLEELRASFSGWRVKKRYVRERVPDELWERVLQASRVHGTSAVARATKLERARIENAEKKRNRGAAAVPSFSELSIAAPTSTSCPIVEVETTTGLKLRFFKQTQETNCYVAPAVGSCGTLSRSLQRSR